MKFTTIQLIGIILIYTCIGMAIGVSLRDIPMNTNQDIILGLYFISCIILLIGIRK